MKKRSIAAPVIIASLLVLFFAGVACVCFIAPFAIAIRIVICVVEAALIGETIYVTIQRIKEIRSGEEDDLSKY